MMEPINGIPNIHSKRVRERGYITKYVEVDGEVQALQQTLFHLSHEKDGTQFTNAHIGVSTWNKKKRSSLNRRIHGPNIELCKRTKIPNNNIVDVVKEDQENINTKIERDAYLHLSRNDLIYQEPNNNGENLSNSILLEQHINNAQDHANLQLLQTTCNYQDLSKAPLFQEPTSTTDKGLGYSKSIQRPTCDDQYIINSQNLADKSLLQEPTTSHNLATIENPHELTIEEKYLCNLQLLKESTMDFDTNCALQNVESPTSSYPQPRDGSFKANNIPHCSRISRDLNNAFVSFQHHPLTNNPQVLQTPLYNYDIPYYPSHAIPFQNQFQIMYPQVLDSSHRSYGTIYQVHDNVGLPNGNMSFYDQPSTLYPQPHEKPKRTLGVPYYQQDHGSVLYNASTSFQNEPSTSYSQLLHKPLNEYYTSYIPIHVDTTRFSSTGTQPQTNTTLFERNESCSSTPYSTKTTRISSTNSSLSSTDNDDSEESLPKPKKKKLKHRRPKVFFTKTFFNLQQKRRALNLKPRGRPKNQEAQNEVQSPKPRGRPKKKQEYEMIKLPPFCPRKKRYARKRRSSLVKIQNFLSSYILFSSIHDSTSTSQNCKDLLELSLVTSPQNRSIYVHHNQHEQQTSLNKELCAIETNSLMVPQKVREIVPQNGNIKPTKWKSKALITIEDRKMWALLSKGGTPNDWEDREYWAQEWELMRTRIAIFNQRMRSILGVKRFSPWKGSVIDSIVGAFLTQNTTDRISSSAFMTLVSNFPAQHPVRECSMEVPFENVTKEDPNLPSTTKQDINPSNNEEVNGSNGSSTVNTSMDPEFDSDKAHLDNKNSKQHSVDDDKQKMAHDDGDVNTKKQANGKNKKKKQEVEGKTKRTIGGLERAHMEENRIRNKDKNNWDSVRRKILESDVDENGKPNARPENHLDSVDWDKIRQTDVSRLSTLLKERGMHCIIAGRVKSFLRRIYEDQGNLDLEWVRKLKPEDARTFLLSIHGLGLKSVECIRLLTLHQVAFPVDVNVARICSRLGWVPLTDFPEGITLENLLEFPELDSTQMYLWDRLFALGHEILYEYHYQLITFGKVICTKSKPKCHICPMQRECKYYALRNKPKQIMSNESHTPLLDSTSNPSSTIVSGNQNDKEQAHAVYAEMLSSPEIEYDLEQPELVYVEAASSPQPEDDLMDIEDYGKCDIYTIDLMQQEQPVNNNSTFLSYEQLRKQHCIIPGCDDPNLTQLGEQPCVCEPNTQGYNQESMGNSRKHADPVLYTNSDAPAPKLKEKRGLSTIHHVFKLPDDHPLLANMRAREKDDPCYYLLLIWNKGETPPGSLGEETNIKEDYVLGTFLIPCKTANRGSFPLNGTYFQPNEVFADNESSLHPIEVPRDQIWFLPRSVVYFGTSVTNIFRGMTMNDIRHCFTKGYICVRGFDQQSRRTTNLIYKFHQPTVMKVESKKGKVTSFNEDEDEE